MRGDDDFRNLKAERYVRSLDGPSWALPRSSALGVSLRLLGEVFGKAAEGDAWLRRISKGSQKAEMERTSSSTDVECNVASSRGLDEIVLDLSIREGKGAVQTGAARGKLTASRGERHRNPLGIRKAV